jgi:hypothetical protein
VHHILELVSMWGEEKYPCTTPCLREEPPKKRVQWGPVKAGALGSGSLMSGPPGWLSGGVQSTTKLASTWLLIAFSDAKSSSNSANFATHLAILLAALGLWSTALSGYEDTTEIL